MTTDKIMDGFDKFTAHLLELYAKRTCHISNAPWLRDQPDSDAFIRFDHLALSDFRWVVRGLREYMPMGDVRFGWRMLKTGMMEISLWTDASDQRWYEFSPDIRSYIVAAHVTRYMIAHNTKEVPKQ